MESSSEARVRGKDFRQACAAFEQVGQRITIESSKEVVACLVENFSEAAGSGNYATVLLGVETFHRFGRSLGIANDLADVYVGRFPRKLDAAAFATVTLDETSAGKIVDHFDQVISRDGVAVGDFGNVDEALAVNRKIHQHAQGIISIERELHGAA
jgi:hypothetical protein